MAKQLSDIERTWAMLTEAVYVAIGKLDNPEDKRLLDNCLRKFAFELNQYFNPDHEWLKNKLFADVFRNFEFSKSDNGMKHTRRIAIVDELKNKCQNDIELAIEVLVLSTKYGTLEFEQNIEKARQNQSLANQQKQKQQPKPQKKQEQDIEEFCKSRGIIIIQNKPDALIIQASDNVAAIAALRKVSTKPLKFQ